tara:strand:- start:478 stop:1035 length:558 start_codon:yes stop_codon:yes gene_type:complete
MIWITFCLFCCTVFCNPNIESEELKLLLKSNKSNLLYQWGPENKLVENTIYFFVENSSWDRSIRWFRKNSETLLQIKNTGIKIVYFSNRKSFLGIGSQAKYEARKKARQIRDAIEYKLGGNQIVQLRSTPTQVIFDHNRNIGKQLGAPRHRLSGLIWIHKTNHFRSFHFLEDSPQSFFGTIRRLK